MTFGWMVMAMVMVARPAAAADLTVCVTSHGTALTSGATSLAGSTFQKAGVAITWQCPEPRTPGAARTWLQVDLVDETPAERLPGSLAVSYPYARCSKGITVFYDRIRSLARGTNRESALLAYVLVHEITHVIQGVNRHSDTGVMKARWSEDDRAAIFERRLGFDDWDVHLMRQGLAAGWCGSREIAQGPIRIRNRFPSGVTTKALRPNVLGAHAEERPGHAQAQRLPCRPRRRPPSWCRRTGSRSPCRRPSSGPRPHRPRRSAIRPARRGALGTGGASRRSFRPGRASTGCQARAPPSLDCRRR